MSENKRVLIVGAGGFAGGYIVDECLRRGWQVSAGVRATTSRKYLTDKRIRFVVFDFDNPDSIGASLLEEAASGGGWDYIVYNLGATKCVRFADFSRINYDYLRYFIAALKQTSLMPEKFLYISSLSAVGPACEKSGAPFDENLIPRPNTRYGASKLKAEMLLQMEGVPYIIFRCTGIYGPRDKDYFLMYEAVRKGFDFSVGFRRQTLTFLYAEDLARAVCDALERSETAEVYNVSHPKSYSQKDFRRIAASALGKRMVIPVRVPLWGLKCVCTVAGFIGALRGKPSTLNSDKYNIMAQRNWSVDVSKAQKGFGFAPQTDLEEGSRRSVEWYKKEGWLK